MISKTVLSVVTANVIVISSALAGGSPENVLLVIDPTSPQSLHVGNYYRAARSIPDRNVVYLAPNPGTYTDWKNATRAAFLGALENQSIVDHVDYVVLTPGVPSAMSAGGIVTDGCSPVTRFAATAPFALAQAYASVPVGTSSLLANQYATSTETAIAFDSGVGWSGGVPNVNGTRYYVAAMLGYDGPLGNTIPEILSMIDRSVAADESHPTGTFHFCQTTDAARSGPRHGLFPAAVAAIGALGIGAQHLMAVLPPSGSTSIGIMTGWADPLIDTTPLTLLPGAFCDHLTSYAGTFDLNSQTKMSRWIAKGASGTCGTVEEPCNYSGKFPTARLHTYYAKGSSLGEAWFRSLGAAPFQVLFTGDPMTRPFAYLPVPSLSGLPMGPVGGTIVVTPTATTPHPTASIAGFELLVDGVSSGTKLPGQGFVVDTSALADGWHEVRCLAWDDTSVKSTGRVVGSLTTANFGRAVTASASATSGSLTQAFDITLAASGGALSAIDLVQGGRVVASTTTSGAIVSVFGRTLGSGRARLQARARFVDGRTAQSAPFEIDVSTVDGPSSGSAPVAFSYVKYVRSDVTALVELPATFDDPLANASWTVSQAPSQGTIVLGLASAPYRFVAPNPGANGSDSMSFSVTTPSGGSLVATVTIVWDPPYVCPAPTNYCTSTPNSTGVPGTMGWSGSTRFADNQLSILATSLPPFTSGVFFYGDGAASIPFGNGFRCVASPIVRLSVQQTDVFGDVQRAIDLTSPPFQSGLGAIHTGSTKRFQFWYRDLVGGGGTFNTTDGIAITFCP